MLKNVTGTKKDSVWWKQCGVGVGDLDSGSIWYSREARVADWSSEIATMGSREHGVRSGGETARFEGGRSEQETTALKYVIYQFR